MAESKKINILCIDDELAVTNYIAVLLDKERYSLTTIADGQKALDFLLTTTVPPDIILLDYILPSLDGLKILRALKVSKKRYSVVFLTGDETLETGVTAMKEGAIDYLTKSRYLKTELNIRIEKAYQLHQERLKTEYYKEQLALLSMAVEQSPNSFVLTDLKGNIEYVNKQFTQYTGYTSNDVIGKNPRILKGGDYPRGFFEGLWKAITSGKTWKGEFINKKKNGTLFYEKAIISPVFNRSGEMVSYLGIKEDITELKKTEQALKKVTEEINHFFTVALDLLCIIDNVTYKFIRLNNAWEDTLGYSIDELVNKPFTDFVHPDDLESTRNACMELDKTGRLVNFVNRYRCNDGSYKFIEWSSITNSDGTYYSSAHDITKRILNEDDLRNRNLIKDKFFSIIAHDLRSQFSVIRGFSELLKTNSKYNELERQNMVDLLHLSSKNGLAMLEDLLEWSRLQLNKLEFVPEQLNLLTLIEDVFSVIKNQAIFKQIEITSNISSDHKVVVDKRMMNIVLRNLLENAIKFTPKGGQIIVSAVIKKQNNIISVKDNGVGMPQDIVEKLFQIDSKHSTQGTEKEKGTGLGLILVREFIEKHGGKISVKSKVDYGSEFIISIPDRENK